MLTVKEGQKVSFWEHHSKESKECFLSFLKKIQVQEHNCSIVEHTNHSNHSNW